MMLVWCNAMIYAHEKISVFLIVMGLLIQNAMLSNIYKEDAVNLHVTTEDEQTEAVQHLLYRLIPEKAHLFHITVNFTFGSKDKDTFMIKNDNGTVSVIANKGYTAAFGIQHYLKKYCGCHISWSGNQLLLPRTLPKLPKPLIKTSNDRYRYYMNVCTFSYSTVWWKWKRWEQEIDWMALNGINLPLAFVGQEAIYKKTMMMFNFTDSDIQDFFTGPAFLAWNRMGNVQTWGSGLSDNWLRNQLELQHLILQRMRAFGMSPVLPAFSGRVPPAIKEVYPEAFVTYSTTKWGHFDQPYVPVAFLEPTDPLFTKIAETFLRLYIKEFGTNHIYNGDLFNEMAPSSSDPEYLANCSRVVYQTLIKVDEKATWLVQGWMFFNDPSIWTEDNAKAFLTAVPLGKVLVLDLQSELYPQYLRMNSFFGQPFIWCMLHNYGGVLGLYGSLPQINQGAFSGRKYNGSTMVGTGITPEGIETNDVVYELMNEMAWRRKSTNLTNWLTGYARRRYGYLTPEIPSAWVRLLNSVYNASVPFRNHGKYILTSRPSLKMKAYVWYNSSDVLEAWKLFGIASQNTILKASKLFRHDFVDITRQGLQLVLDSLYVNLQKAYAKSNLALFRNISLSVLGLYDDMEKLLASDEHFLLGSWIQAAKDKAETAHEMKQYRINALNQITLWGPTGQILDYGNKQWSGIMKNYYQKRWLLFVDLLGKCLQEKKRFNQTEYNLQVLDSVAIPFTQGTEEYPIYPQGDSVEISQLLLKKYLFSDSTTSNVIVVA